jgi:hypothetical protein
MAPLVQPGAGWTRVAQVEGFEKAWRARMGDDSPPPVAWQRGPIRALVGREVWRDGTTRWHISVSGPGRVPTWDELVEAAHALRPGVPFTMGVPPRSWWMNVHPHVLHMWESRDRGLIDEWQTNAQGHEPT